MKVVIDTHILFWLLTGQQEKITSKAFVVLQAATEVIVPTIVLLELLGLCAKLQKIAAFDMFVSEIEESNYVVLPLDFDGIKTTRAIKAKLELHDRVIVATAKSLNLPIITKDEQITKVYKKIIW